MQLNNAQEIIDGVDTTEWRTASFRQHLKLVLKVAQPLNEYRMTRRLTIGWDDMTKSVSG